MDSAAHRHWDSRLDLDDVTLVAPLTAATAQRVIPILREFGVALVAPAEPAALAAPADAARAADLLAFGRALGTPTTQSPRAELVEDVKDFTDVDDHDDRGYRSAGGLRPHSDPPTLLVLHCLRAARHGGESSLVNVASIVDRMAADDPALLDELFAPLPDWRVAGQHGVATAGPGDPRPVLTRHRDRISCVLYRPHIERAAATGGPRLTAAQTAALDRFEHHSTDEELTVRFVLRPGATLVLHNRAVLHARTDYVDWPQPARRRHLLRMWIDAPHRFPVDAAHELGDFFAPRAPVRSGR